MFNFYKGLYIGVRVKAYGKTWIIISDEIGSSENTQTKNFMAVSADSIMPAPIKLIQVDKNDLKKM